MATCSNCESGFRKRTGGYYRYSLERRIESSGLPAWQHLSEVTGCVFSPVKRAVRFLCPDCWNKLNDTVRYKSSMDALFTSTSETSYVAQKRKNVEEKPSTSFITRPRFTSTPIKKTSSSTAKTHKSGKWDSIIKAVRARQYSRAISGLYNATKGSKCKFAEVVTRIVRKEIKMLLDMPEDFTLCRDVTVRSISEFSWDRTIENACLKAPVLLSCLKGAVTTKSNESSLLRNGKTNLKPRIGTTLALLLNSKQPRKCNFLQTLLSVQFWRGRLKRDSIKQLSKLGLCMSYEATLTAIDRIRSDFDSAAIKCKADIESALKENRVDQPLLEDDPDLSTALSMTVPNLEDEIVEYPEMEDIVLYSDNDSALWHSMEHSPENSNSDSFDFMEDDADDDEVEEMEEAKSSSTDGESDTLKGDLEISRRRKP